MKRIQDFMYVCVTLIIINALMCLQLLEEIFLKYTKDWEAYVQSTKRQKSNFALYPGKLPQDFIYLVKLLPLHMHHYEFFIIVH